MTGMSQEERRRSTIGYEGQVLSSVTAWGPERASDLARCLVDGGMNALVRIEGVEATARYGFALADRIAGGLKEPTRIFPQIEAVKPEPPTVLEPEPDAPPAEPEAPRFYTAYLCLLSAGVGAFLGYWWR